MSSPEGARHDVNTNNAPKPLPQAADLPVAEGSDWYEMFHVAGGVAEHDPERYIKTGQANLPPEPRNNPAEKTIELDTKDVEFINESEEISPEQGLVNFANFLKRLSGLLSQHMRLSRHPAESVGELSEAGKTQLSMVRSELLTSLPVLERTLSRFLHYQVRLPNFKFGKSQKERARAYGEQLNGAIDSGKALLAKMYKDLKVPEAAHRIDVLDYSLTRHNQKRFPRFKEEWLEGIPGQVTNIRPFKAGGFSWVWRAQYNGHPVVIKRLRVSIDNQAALERFAHEAEVMAKAGHDIFPKFYTAQDNIIVMEFVTGRELAAALRKKQLSTEQAAELAAEIAVTVHFRVLLPPKSLATWPVFLMSFLEMFYRLSV